MTYGTPMPELEVEWFDHSVAKGITSKLKKIGWTEENTGIDINVLDAFKVLQSWIKTRIDCSENSSFSELYAKFQSQIQKQKLSMELNSVDENITKDMLTDNNKNNNGPEGGGLESSVGKTTDQHNNDPVITVQPPTNGSIVERPPPRVRRASDVIDSLGLDGPHSPATPKGADYFFSSNSPVDNGYNSSTPSPVNPKFPPEKQGRNVADTIDAAGCKVQPEPEPDQDLPMQESSGEVEATMPVEKDAEEYNMNHPRRGRAIIFNHDEFLQNYANREGSDMDVKNLMQLYEALGFETTVYHNKMYGEIKAILEKLADEDHSDADCIALTVLTHGLQTGYVLAKDHPYPVENLWAPFVPHRCLTLAGKPKLFFIQACRGERLDPGVRLVSKKMHRTETDSASPSYKIPSHADFLMVYSSAEGFYSFRNPESGTWFIQCMCEEIKENADKHDLLKLLTRTSRRVAVNHESYNDMIPWQNEQKQVPTITSMLIRDVYFHRKK